LDAVRPLGFDKDEVYTIFDQTAMICAIPADIIGVVALVLGGKTILIARDNLLSPTIENLHAEGEERLGLHSEKIVRAVSIGREGIVEFE
jgi:hypothetical protein